MIAFQKRHYEFIAGVLRANQADPKMVEAFADALKSTNWLFKREKFIEAATAEKDS